ncbi:hypothetical protein WJX73_000215 [Symbiochloris irregularis]|uniref:Exostosin GT47 domain-containing protein n=1 Tax=Symbiochloris irregularis TaxID=706552 RepID=A0AAW1P813_9CHLO
MGRQQSRALGALLLALALACASGVHAELDVCNNMKIYILDIADFAEEKGYPKCHLNETVAVDANLGIAYLRIGEHDPELPNKPLYYSVHSKFGTHAAPWHLAEAIKTSNCSVSTMEEAHLVYVYDYCYYIWWVARRHSLQGDYSIPENHPVRTEPQPGEYLLKAWKAVFELPRFRRTHGRDFIFYDAHPGFVEGQIGHAFHDAQCNEMRRSVQLLVDLPQRSFCQDYWNMRTLIITPNNPSVVNIDYPDIEDTFKRPRVPLSERNTLLYFSGTCGNWENMGKTYRRKVALALNASAPHVQESSVACSDKFLNGTHKEFVQMLTEMEHSKFCLVLPGDSQSTRRLSEIFMAGCIPVFVGAPFNSMPLAGSIDYASVAVVFNVTNTSAWLPEPMQWNLSEQGHATYATDAQWWLPDAPVNNFAISVPNVEAIWDHLTNMPAAEIQKKADLMHNYRFYMTFNENLSGEQHAVHQILKSIFWRRQKHVATFKKVDCCLHACFKTDRGAYPNNCSGAQGARYLTGQQANGSIAETG